MPQATGKGFGAPAKGQQETKADRSKGSTGKKEHARIDGTSSKVHRQELVIQDDLHASRKSKNCSNSGRWLRTAPLHPCIMISLTLAS